VTWSTGRCLIKVRAEFSAKHGLHLAHGHHKKVHRHESLSALLVNLGRKTKTFANGTRVGVAEPCTGEARTLSQGALLAVQQELAARQELDLQATMAEAEGPPCDGRTPGPHTRGTRSLPVKRRHVDSRHERSDPVSPKRPRALAREICPTDAYFESLRWRSTCDHPVVHQPLPRSRDFPGASESQGGPSVKGQILCKPNLDH